MHGFENVLEDAAKVDPSGLVCEYRHCAVFEIERTNIVEAENVIDVAVRDQNGIKPLDICPQGLLTKIDRCIDEDLFVLVFDQDRNPQPLVARVVGQARLTITPDRRNTGRCAGS
jgi:hypothetical protein